MSIFPAGYCTSLSAALRSALAVFAFCSSATAAAFAGPVELAAALDLHADSAAAAHQGRPLVLLFSLPECSYCAVVRKNYLAPMAREQRAADRYVVRELTLNANTPIAGFNGERTTAAAVAAQYGLRVAPSVVLIGPGGALLTPPLVGGDVSGMYGAYLDQALKDAQAELGKARISRSTHSQP